MDKYIGEFYETKEEAELALINWRQERYAAIEGKGDKVLSDNSYVYKRLVWKQKELTKEDQITFSYESDEFKWFIMHLIWTQEMVDDIKKMKFL